MCSGGGDGMGGGIPQRNTQIRVFQVNKSVSCFTFQIWFSNLEYLVIADSIHNIHKEALL